MHKFDELNTFLVSADEVYKKKLLQIPLFADSIQFNLQQLQLFIRLFYHIRGHFHDFLWYLLNHAPNKKIKQIIIDNIAEEAGGDRLSHEQLYFVFGQEYQIDLTKESLEKTYYLPFIQSFNKAHLEWLIEHDWQHGLCAYSAYERLDNLDYQALYQLAKQQGTSEQGLTFFKVHKQVKHFEQTLDEVLELWLADPMVVKEAYKFIYKTQLLMWRQLSDYVLEQAL